MKSIEIRQKLHQYIETALDKKLKAIYTMVENEIEELNNPWNDAAFVAQIEKREQSYLNGEAKTYSWEEVQQRAKQAFQKARNKK
jgi:hypothetical protein